MSSHDANLTRYLLSLSKELAYPIHEESPDTLLDMICLELEKRFLDPENEDDFAQFHKFSNYADVLKQYQLEAQAKALFLEMTYRLVAPFFQAVYNKLIVKLALSQSISLFSNGKGLNQQRFKPETWAKYQYDSRKVPLMLLIEPNPELGNLLTTIAQNAFGEKLLILNASASGTLGLLYALRFRPDFIFTDGLALYGRMNGYEMLALLQEFPETWYIPFSLLTASDEKFVPGRILQAAQDYLQKPFDLGKYEAVIQAYLDRLKCKTAS